MKKQLVTLVALLCLSVPGAVLAEPRSLLGHVVLVQKDDQTRDATGAQVELRGHGNPTRTDNSGYFKLFLPNVLKPGDPIRLAVKYKGYRVWSPLQGETLVPQNLATQVLEVRMLPEGSTKFFSEEVIEQMLREAATSTSGQPQAKAGAAPTDLSRFIADWAHQYGFSARQVKAEVDRWVSQVEKKRDNDSRMALAAFARGDFQGAARLAGASAEQGEQRLEAMEAERQRHADKVADDYSLQGQALLLRSPSEPGAALRAYEKASKYLSKQGSPLRWASIWTSLGVSHVMLGRDLTGAARRERYEAAVVAYRRALEVTVREQMPLEWASTYVNLSSALLELGQDAEGTQRTELLKQAEEAARLGLQADTLKIPPVTHESLQRLQGDALLDLGRSTPGRAGIAHFAQAAEAYRRALATPICNCPEKMPPEMRADIVRLLGHTLLEQSLRVDSSAEHLRLTEQAEKAFTLALTVYTPEQHPQLWFETQSNLGLALLQQAINTQGGAKLPLLSRSLESHCLSLSRMSQQDSDSKTVWGALVSTLAEQVKALKQQVDPANTASQEKYVESEMLSNISIGMPGTYYLPPGRARQKPHEHVGLEVMGITSLLGRGEASAVPGHLEALRAFVTTQPPDFKVGRDFSTLRCIVQNHPGLASWRPWLFQLIEAVRADQRNAIVEGLDKARANFHVP